MIYYLIVILFENYSESSSKDFVSFKTCVLAKGECETLIGASLIGCPGCPVEVHFPAKYNCTSTGLHLDGIAPRRDLYLDVPSLLKILLQKNKK
jgi:hypothetical protein